MTSLATAFVTISPNMTGFGARLSTGVSSAAGQAGQQGGSTFTKKFGAALKIGGLLAGAFAVAKGGAFLKDSISEASDLGESLNAINVSYGKNAGSIMKLGREAADAVGLSNVEFNNLAVQFSAFSGTIAGKGGDVTGVLEDLTTRGADFASVMNLEVNDAMGLFQSGLAGETEPLRKFGIDLSAAKVEAFAYAEGIAKAGVPLTEQQKVQARYGALMQQTAKTQGDFANTSDSLANSQRRLGAHVDNLQARLGGVFIPVMERLSGIAVNRVLPALNDFGDWFSKEGLPVIKDFAGYIRENFGPVIESIGGIFSGNSKGMGDFRSEFAKVGGALTEFGAGVLPVIAKIGEDIGRVVGPAIKDIARMIVSDFLPAFREALPILQPVAVFLLKMFGSAVVGFIKGVVQAIKGFIQVISGVFKLVVALVRGDWGKAWKAVKQIATGVMNAVIGFIKAWFNFGILAIFKGGIKALLGSWRSLWTGLRGLATKAFGGLRSLFNSAVAFLGRIISGFVKAVGRFWTGLFNGIKGTAVAGWRVLRSTFGGALAAIRTVIVEVIARIVIFWRNLFTSLKTRATTAMSDIRQGISNVLDKIKGAFSKAVTGIGKVWNGIKEAARKPVEFVVNTVYNDGIRRVVNAIPGVGDLPSLHFARGGPVPQFGGSTAGKDSVKAMLMPDEHVWTRDEVKKAGGHNTMRRMREMAKNGTLRAATGDPGWDLAPGFAEGGGFSIQSLMRAGAWAQAQAGKPYIWGGVGPAGFDCSGFMSGIQNVLLGGSGYGTRYGTSGSFPWGGWQPGPGQFTVGAFTGDPGHVAGNLAGMNVESTNGSVRVGGAARGPYDGMFTRQAHLGAGGDYGSKGGGGNLFTKFKEVLGAIKAFAKNIGGWISEIKNMGGWGGMIRDMITGVVHGVEKWIDDKIPIPIPDLFDNGGVLQPGRTGMNRSGKPERVLDPRTTANFERLTEALDRGRGGPSANRDAMVHIEHMHVRDEEAVAKATTREWRKVLAVAGGA